MAKYKAEVNTQKQRPYSYAHAAIEFDSADEAHEYVRDLFQRWTAVVTWRVVERDDQTRTAIFTNEKPE